MHRHFMYRKTLALLLTAALTAASFAACGSVNPKTAEDAADADTEVSSETSSEAENVNETGNTDLQSSDTESGLQPDDPTASDENSSDENSSDDIDPALSGPYDKAASAASDSHYTFKTHVTSSVIDDMMGQDIHDAYYNFIDAVLKGETSFDCKDEFTFQWMMGQYTGQFFPVVDAYVIMGNFSNGKGHFSYSIPYEEFQVKLQEFEDLVTGILNEALEDDYSDIEKALALLLYFRDHYTYDYDEFDTLQKEGYIENADAYRLLTEGTEVCQGISFAYSYLLLEAGVDATIVKGDGEDGIGHQWSLVTIDGKYYHIDPTFYVSGEGLNIFLMNDEERYAVGGYDPTGFVYASNYYQHYDHGEYPADDDTYSPLWGTYLLYWDSDQNVMHLMNGYADYFDFEYEDFYSAGSVGK